MGVAPRLTSAVRLLVVDADPTARRAVRAALEARIARPLTILETGARDTARAMLADRGFDVLVADLDTVGGPAGIAALIERAPSVVAYALGDAANVRDAVAAVRQGAADFIEKPLDGAAFARRIERQFGTIDVVPEPGDLPLGDGRAMRALADHIGRVAPSAAPVFVFGEPGTGKADVARAVHGRSRRRAGPFVAVDCRGRDAEGLTADLVGADGAFDRAAGGTLFLDEVGALPDAVQAVLLRWLDAGEIGGLADRRTVSCRLVVSSNRRGPGEPQRAGLRPDLYFRLAVLTLDVPPLRERAEDLPLLVDDLARRLARAGGRRPPRFSPGARERLARHDWPGNLRELANLVERLMASGAPEPIDEQTVEALLEPAPRAEAAAVRPLWMEEAALIERAIAAFDGNIARAAAALEISPSTIYRKRRGRDGESFAEAG